MLQRVSASPAVITGVHFSVYYTSATRVMELIDGPSQSIERIWMGLADESLCMLRMT